MHKKLSFQVHNGLTPLLFVYHKHVSPASPEVIKKQSKGRYLPSNGKILKAKSPGLCFPSITILLKLSSITILRFPLLKSLKLITKEVLNCLLSRGKDPLHPLQILMVGLRVLRPQGNAGENMHNLGTVVSFSSHILPQW